MIKKIFFYIEGIPGLIKTHVLYESKRNTQMGLKRN
jgi:hypothetical protein